MGLAVTSKFVGMHPAWFINSANCLSIYTICRIQSLCTLCPRRL